MWSRKRDPSSQSVTNPPPLPWRWWHGVLLAVLTVLGALPRVLRIGAHEGFSWDESYYVPAAREYLDGTFSSNFEHPPLAKWAIAAGIELLGDEPLRLAAGGARRRGGHDPPDLAPGAPPPPLRVVGQPGRDPRRHRRPPDRAEPHRRPRQPPPAAAGRRRPVHHRAPRPVRAHRSSAGGSWRRARCSAPPSRSSGKRHPR